MHVDEGRRSDGLSKNDPRVWSNTLLVDCCLYEYICIYIYICFIKYVNMLMYKYISIYVLYSSVAAIVVHSKGSGLWEYTYTILFLSNIGRNGMEGNKTTRYIAN